MQCEAKHLVRLTRPDETISMGECSGEAVWLYVADGPEMGHQEMRVCANYKQQAEDYDAAHPLIDHPSFTFTPLANL